MPVITSDVWLPRPRGEVFEFFADPRNLGSITPSWLRFRILPPAPRRMRKGTLLSYALSIRVVPVWWVTRIAAYDPPHMFVDRQLWGPYTKWVHTHTFEEEAGGTRVRDRVEYAHLGGAWIERRFVRPDLEEIFAYRREVLRRTFARPKPAAP